MKNWILTHKLLTVILACVIGVGAVCAVTIPLALRHKHEFSAEWSYDDTYHFHKCLDEKCEEVADKAEHVFDKEVVADKYFVSEATYTEAAKYYKSCLCGAKGKETFNSGSTLSAKENDVNLKEGVTLGKTYDGEAFNLTAEEIVRNGDGAITFMYKIKDSEAEYVLTAPVKAGEYTVKVSVAATAEWKEAEKTFDFTIAKKSLTATANKPYDGTNTIPDVIPEGVCKDDDVKVIVFMSDKNVGSIVTSLMLEGADKDNYMLTAENVTASITAKQLTVTATKEYDGNAIMPATLTGVVSGETVTVAVTMESKNVGATVKEVTLDGADKGNYEINQANVTASITPKTISVEWEHYYNNESIITGEPAELLAGDGATITVTMSSANVGAAVQSFEITGKDAANYSLAREDVNVEIVKANISGFTISNADAFNKIVIGAQSIPDPKTNYKKIGTGYGEMTIVWEKQLEGGVWSRNLTKEEVIQSKTGTFQVRIQYAEGDNYKFGATTSVKFTMKAKTRTLAVRNFTGKTYDGKPVENFTYENLAYKLSTPSIEGGVEDITPIPSGEKYVEYRKQGETLWTKVTDTYIPKNAAEYEYRIGITATDEWEAVVSDSKSFTIRPYEFVLELGYVENQHNQSLDSGKTFKLRTFSKANEKELIEGQVIQLWLDNEKAGLQTEKRTGGYYFIPDQKKQVRTDCFFLKIANLVSANMENYKIVPKYSNVTTVEMTVVERLTTEKSTTGKIQLLNETEKWIRATVEKGSFKVGQTVEVYNSAGTKLGEATITQIKVKGTISASGFAIPSDGLVEITLDQVFSGMVNGKLVEK